MTLETSQILKDRRQVQVDDHIDILMPEMSGTN